jgi:outer membrane protein TolC
MSNPATVHLLAAAAFVLAGASPALAQAPPSADTLTLRRAVELAMEHAPEVAVSRAEAEEALSSARLTKAGLKPFASISTTPGYSTGLPVQVAGQVPAIFGFEVRQTLYDPSRRALVYDAEAVAADARGAYAKASTAAARAATLSYARVWTGQKRVENARRRVEARETVLRRVSVLRREGRRTDLEVESSGLQVARAKQKLLDAQSELDLDRLELSRLIDWPSGRTLILSEDPRDAFREADAGDHLARARASDPEMKAMSDRIAALERSVSLAEKTWRPIVEAEAQYLRLASYNNFDQYFNNFKENNFTVGVSVVLPLWSGGRFAEQRVTARSRLSRAEADRRVREKELELSVRRAEAALVRAGAEASLSARASAVAREELRVARALADEGRAEPDAVELREIALGEAEDEEATAAQGLLAARVKLLELTGALAGPVPAPSSEIRAAIGIGPR